MMVAISAPGVTLVDKRARRVTPITCVSELDVHSLAEYAWDKFSALFVWKTISKPWFGLPDCSGRETSFRLNKHHKPPEKCSARR